MTINEAIAKVDGLCPNAYTEAQKVAWLSEVDGRVALDINKVTTAPVAYAWPDDGDTGDFRERKGNCFGSGATGMGTDAGESVPRRRRTGTGNGRVQTLCRIGCPHPGQDDGRPATDLYSRFPRYELRVRFGEGVRKSGR